MVPGTQMICCCQSNELGGSENVKQIIAIEQELADKFSMALTEKNNSIQKKKKNPKTPSVSFLVCVVFVKVIRTELKGSKAQRDDFKDYSLIQELHFFSPLFQHQYTESSAKWEEQHGSAKH